MFSKLLETVAKANYVLVFFQLQAIHSAALPTTKAPLCFGLFFMLKQYFMPESCQQHLALNYLKKNCNKYLIRKQQNLQCKNLCTNLFSAAPLLPQGFSFNDLNVGVIYLVRQAVVIMWNVKMSRTAAEYVLHLANNLLSRLCYLVWSLNVGQSYKAQIASMFVATLLASKRAHI